MNIPFASFLLSWLSFAAAFTIPVPPNLLSNLLFNFIIVPTSATNAELQRISLYLYTNETTAEYTSALVGNATDLLLQMNSTKPTVFYVFGWTETPESTSVKTVMGAYLERGDHNIILLSAQKEGPNLFAPTVVNWQEIAAELYPFAAASAEKVGKAVAGAINQMVASGLNPTSVHIVGHSLGAQVAGFIGRNVNFRVRRITGLDPAGPEFHVVIAGLTSTDARFVDVIHTDAGLYGTAASDVTVNFYPNGGTRVQPGCPSVRVPATTADFCDHHRSWYYFAESLLNEEAFIGVECSTYTGFSLGSCSSNTKVVMGYATPTTASGKFYLQTNNGSPFGRGKAGETYTA